MWPPDALEVVDGRASGDEAGDRMARRGVTEGPPVMRLRLAGECCGLLLAPGMVTLCGEFVMARMCGGLKRGRLWYRTKKNVAKVLCLCMCYALLCSN